MKPIIKIDVASDVVCPWCYIGKRRLEKAIAQLYDQYTFEVSYLPFELNPEMPESGQYQKEYLIHKFGDEAKYYQLTNHTSTVAASEGLHFDFSKQHISPNTRRVHSLIQAAKQEGKQLETAEAFFKAYFTEGIDLSKKQNLISVAMSAGLPRDMVEKQLADDSALAEVALAETEMHRHGINSVPFYIINNRYAISGAQAVETLVKALEEIGEEMAVQKNP